MDPLFANHFHFMATHRGSVGLSGGDVHVEGSIPALTSFVPASESSRIPPGCPAVRLAPWSGADWPLRLAGDGFTKAETLNYLERPGSDPLPVPAGAGIEVKTVQSDDEARIFAQVQSAGFGADAWWEAHFTQQALRNHARPEQSFYLGCREGAPVTTTVVVRHAGVAGIYAVATDPQHRRLGGSGAVLERVRLDAVNAGFPRLVLQATAGSYAESYYQRLGFQQRYLSEVWRRGD